MESTDYQALIRRYREEKMISQKEFADLIGVSFASVNRWENGHFTPTLKARRKIRDLLEKDGADASAAKRGH